MIDIDRAALLGDLQELNACGAQNGPGINRVAFSTADQAGRAFVEGRLRALGLSVSRDVLGSTLGILPGSEPNLRAIATGSHTDSVPGGGRFDGALGVVAAIACARAVVADEGHLRHSWEVLNFVAEEATMGPGTLGSRAMAGAIDPASLDDLAYDGRPVAEHLHDAGCDPGRIAEAKREPGILAAYLELHIEQGGTMWCSGDRLAVVQGIVGIRRFEVVFEGMANHAGTTAMSDRRDALVAAAPLIGAVGDIATGCGIVATVGTLRVEPGVSNVIPGRVTLECEMRSLERRRLDEAEHQLRDHAGPSGGRVVRLQTLAPVHFDPQLLAVLVEVTSRFGVGVCHLASGAGHDAGSMASLCPVAMLFVPSVGGVSHAPNEETSPEDCFIGARALLASIRELDRRLDG